MKTEVSFKIEILPSLKSLFSVISQKETERKIQVLLGVSLFSFAFNKGLRKNGSLAHTAAHKQRSQRRDFLKAIFCSQPTVRLAAPTRTGHIRHWHTDEESSLAHYVSAYLLGRTCALVSMCVLLNSILSLSLSLQYLACLLYLPTSLRSIYPIYLASSRNAPLGRADYQTSFLSPTVERHYIGQLANARLTI